MPNKVQIVPAAETDLPAIKQLLAELMEAMKSTEGFEIDQSIVNCRRLLQDPDNYMLVARDDGQILGFVNFTTRKTILHPGASGLIDELVVGKSSQGSGIGKRLILAVIEKCRELGCCEVEVSTEKTNARARRFYKSCGIDEDAVLLEIDL